MIYLGIDFGSKRVGIARSDNEETMAWPVTVLQNTGSLMEEIEKICKEYDVEEIVVGESKNFDMQKNEIMKDIEPFVKSLKEKLNKKVHLHPEFFTSQEAERLQGKNAMLDASAAAIILKSFLDTKHSKQIEK